MTTKILPRVFYFIICIIVSPSIFYAQTGEIFNLTAESLQDDKQVALDKTVWRYRAGDDAAWAALNFDDTAWETIEGTIIKPELLRRADWRGRAWFRLRVNVAEDLADKNVALIGGQRGASEIYLDGRLLAKFGEISDADVTEYNPSRLPIPFRFGTAGEHTIAVRFASSAFGDLSSGAARWLMRGGYSPGFSLSIRDASDLNRTIRNYVDASSMRGGFFFGGVLLALALLHLLLYLFYPVERANLFYSIYAAAFAFLILCGNFLASGHQSYLASTILGIISSTMLALSFIALLAFLHVAFGRPLGKIFWILTAFWLVSTLLDYIFPNNLGAFIMLKNILIGLSFTFSILLLVKALREKCPGAWILMVGVQILALGMFTVLLNQFSIFDLPSEFFAFGEIALILAVPVAVSVFLARNFARTNRDLEVKLGQVEELSRQKIEQERQAVKLRAENERRAKELEEARQLQLSMLPKKLPQIPNLEIAAYMKPATEVGGDYYDFHVGTDGTLTVAIGDATGHGLKAGSMVTATKSLFNNLADESDITHIFKQSSAALKKMNFRGLFMAMTILKVKDNSLLMSAAGMPSALIYHAASRKVEEVVIRAMPLGSVSNFAYRQQEFTLSAGDCVVVMSDGFPEMFNEAGEMQDFAQAKIELEKTAQNSPQAIIEHFVKTGEAWARTRPPDDDVTFVVLKFKDSSGAVL